MKLLEGPFRYEVFTTNAGEGKDKTITAFSPEQAAEIYAKEWDEKEQIPFIAREDYVLDLQVAISKDEWPRRFRVSGKLVSHYAAVEVKDALPIR